MQGSEFHGLATWELALFEHPISIAVRGQSLTTYVDGALVNQLADASIPSGAAGPNIWHGKTLFRDLKVRHMR